MNSVARPQIRCEQHHATLSVSDVQASAEFYATKLGFVVAFSEGDPPTFAGVNFDCVQIFLTQGQPAPRRALSILSSMTRTGCMRGIDPTVSRSSSRRGISRTGSANTLSATWTDTVCILVTGCQMRVSPE